VLITHKDNPIDDISLADVRDIYSGKITNWKDIGGKDEKIELYTRKSKFSGVGRTLRKLIFADFDYEIASTRAFKSSGPLEKAIIKTPNAIGFTGISSARLRDVKILSLNGVAPSYDNVKSGEYLLYRTLYLTYNPSSPKLEEVRRFIRFCHSREGRAIMKANGTLPYREAVHLVMKQIDQDLAAFRRSDGLGFSAKTN
jgi:phosphate transport system substrate-binding protein